MPKAYDTFRFIGGLDINTPYLARSPGTLLRALNYEPDPDGGYRLMPGYERYDGRQSPTNTEVRVIPVDAVFSTEPALGDVVTGNSSNVTSAYLGQDSERNEIYVFNVSGRYQNNETLNSTTVTTTSLDLAAAGLLDDTVSTTFFRQAREYNRTQITEVPGSGPVRFVFEHQGVVYAIRDNAPATAANIFRDTPTGWDQIDLTISGLLRFDNGQASSLNPFAIEQTVTGGTSGATGVVTGVANQSADRQAGYITLRNTTGTFQDNEQLEVNGSHAADANGTLETISLNAGGTYQGVSYNFFGFSSTNSIYFTNGLQTAMQFDGVSLAPIETGQTVDTPINVVAHHDHLFLAFANGRLIHSVISEPLHFRGDLGAVEFALGSEITNLIQAPLALVITTEDNIQALYGQNATNWQKSFISQKSIGVPNSGQYLIQPLVVDNSGVISISKVDQFGNFQDAIVNDGIRSLLNRLAPLVTNSSINKFRNHYYLFTSVGENILTGFSNNEFIGYFPFDLGRNVLFSSANEGRAFFTDDTGGFVYHWQIGTSHDGEAREAYLQTTYAFQGNPQLRKRYRRVTISLNTFITVNLQIAFAFNKGDGLTNDSSFIGRALGGGGRWDLDNWNEILWDGQDVPELISDIDGVGTDVSMFLYSNSAELPSFVMEDIIYEYSTRSIKR